MRKSLIKMLLVKMLLISFSLMSFGAAPALASNITSNVTWGKDKLLAVQVDHDGKIYQGHLIGVAIEQLDQNGARELHIEKVGVLVYGLSFFGLDQVVPLIQELHSPLCKSFHYPYTNLWGGHQTSGDALVARFVAPAKVTLQKESRPWYTKSLTCSPRFADTSGD
jgi:hypothetical protein